MRKLFTALLLAMSLVVATLGFPASPAAAETVPWKTTGACTSSLGGYFGEYRHGDQQIYSGLRGFAQVYQNASVDHDFWCEPDTLCVEYWQWGQPLRLNCTQNIGGVNQYGIVYAPYPSVATNTWVYMKYHCLAAWCGGYGYNTAFWLKYHY